MLCVTGNERDTEALARRLEEVARRLSGVVDEWLCEVRLDCLASWDEGIFGLLSRYRDRCLVCCRPVRQGGFFDGAEAQRLALLERVEAAQVAYLDVEADVPAAFLDRRARERSALLLSWHDFQGIPADLPGLLARMRGHRPDVLKLAVTVQDAAELVLLRVFADRIPEPHVLIAMGEAGRMSRIRYPLFGSRWTYVAAFADGLTAPGQLLFDEALAMGLPQTARQPFFALVGGAQIGFSPGPRVYNRYFRARGLPYSYFGVITQQPEAAFALLQEAGALGVSVTMPHKRSALSWSAPDAVAQQVGSANTLRFAGPAVISTNTDVAGVAEPLRRALAFEARSPALNLGAGDGARSADPLRGALGAQAGSPACNLGEGDGARAAERARRARSVQAGAAVLILGAGGAARAAAVACRALDLCPVVSARSYARAQAELGPLAEVIPWEARAACPARILVNATPLTGAAQSPWPDGAALEKDVVFDLALGEGRSRLLGQAEQEGALAIHPLEMWLHQGAAQLGFFLGRAVTAEALREYLPCR